MDYEQIKTLCKQNNLSIKELSEKIGMSDAGLYRAFINNSLKVETLEKIANVLGVSAGNFFDNSGDALNNIKEIRSHIKNQDITIEFWYYIQHILSECNEFYEPLLQYLNSIIPINEKKEIINKWLKWNKEQLLDFNKENNVKGDNNLTWDQLGQFYFEEKISEIYIEHEKKIDSAIIEGSAVFIRRAIEDSLITLLIKEEFISNEEFIDNTTNLIANHFRIIPKDITVVYKKYFKANEVERYFENLVKNTKRFPIVSQ